MARGGCEAVGVRQTYSILTLMGGPSAEREISLQSGQAVAAALEEVGHRVVRSDVGPAMLEALPLGGVDVVFPVLHGTFGEDGQLQSFLEGKGVRYAGSDAASSRLAMNKQETKRVWGGQGLAVPRGVLCKAGEFRELDRSSRQAYAKRMAGELGDRLVVKPNGEGSSIGVHFVEGQAELAGVLEEAVAKHGDCVVEERFMGKELTVGVLGEEVLPVLEIRPKAAFYDFRAKYEDNQTEYCFDIDLPEALLMEIQKAAGRAFKVLGCRDFGRVDVMAAADGRYVLLEVNTIPGFTSHSLLPKAAERAGWGFGALCDRIVQLAMNRPI